MENPHQTGSAGKLDADGPCQNKNNFLECTSSIPIHETATFFLYSPIKTATHSLSLLSYPLCHRKSTKLIDTTSI